MSFDFVTGKYFLVNVNYGRISDETKRSNSKKNNRENFSRKKGRCNECGDIK
jgi:hypothetical protein